MATERGQFHFTAFSVLNSKLIIIAGASRGYDTIKEYRYQHLCEESSSGDKKEDPFKKKKKKRITKRPQKEQTLLQYTSGLHKFINYQYHCHHRL